MPIIANILKHGVFYLYPSVQSALEGEKAGGTGFFVGLRTKGGHDFEYAVTNRHVIESGNTVIRLNKVEPKPEPTKIVVNGFSTIDTDKNDWTYHPDGADVAVKLVVPNPLEYFFVPIPTACFIGIQHLESGTIDVGDETFMLGRFIYQAGRKSNIPAARSGIISALPNSDELIKLGELEPQEAFLVEMRSLPGFSGSPTFLQSDMGEFQLKFEAIAEKVYRLQKPSKANEPDLLILLLGIDAGSFPIFEQVYINDKGTYYPHPEFVSKNPTGFSVVIPAWKIAELLETEALLKERHRLSLDRKNG